MSDVFANMNTSLGDTLAEGQIKAGEAAAKLKDKKEETSKTVEEGLASLKVMMGGKGVIKGLLGDPLVKQYASQLKKKAIDGVKDIVNKGITKVQDGLSQATRGAVGANPSAVASTGGEEGAEAAGEEAAEDVAPVSGTLQLTTFGDGDDDFDDIVDDDDFEGPEGATGFEASEPTDDAVLQTTTFGGEEAGSTAIGQTTSSAFATGGASATPEVDVAAQAAAGASKAAPAIFDSDEAAQAAAKVAAAASGGEDAAVGFGEALLGGLDAIPGLDIFTLLGGAALGIGAAAKKRIPSVPVMPAPPQAHVAIASGFQNV